MPIRATLNGNITATGGENADTRGFDYGYVSGAYASSWTEAGSFGAEAFSRQITGFEFNRVVYFRAKAHNSAGWGYGAEQSFTTPPPGRLVWAKTWPVPREVLEVLVDYYELKVQAE